MNAAPEVLIRTFVEMNSIWKEIGGVLSESDFTNGPSRHRREPAPAQITHKKHGFIESEASEEETET